MMKVWKKRAMRMIEWHYERERSRRDLVDWRSQEVTEKLEDPTQLTKTRREIAQLLTVLTERGETGIEEKQYHLETEARRKVAQ